MYIPTTFYLSTHCWKIPDLKLFSLILAKKPVFPDCKKFLKFSLIGGNPEITTISQFYGAFTLPETETKTYKIVTDPNGNVLVSVSVYRSRPV